MSFKVMCIANGEQWKRRFPKEVKKSFLWGLYSTTKKIDKENGPSYGEFCTVVATVKECGEYWYYLKEYPLDLYKQSCNYSANQFIPLSEIDETELVNTKQLINQ